MRLLNDIKEALEGVGLPHVFYGIAGAIDGEALWDYIVFSRESLRPSPNRTGYTDRITVAIVMEEFIQDEVTEKVIKAMTGLDGVRIADSEHAYTYATKTGTDALLEMLVLHFTRPRKDLS